jgi:predicted SAM-dependent methyltransferase
MDKATPAHEEVRTGEYDEKGEYHLHLDPNWPYLPVYLTKRDYVESFMERHGRGCKIVDLGCGEGVLVREYRQRGFDIIGQDLHYESEFVRRGSLLDTGFEDQSFDILLCLDVLEHLNFDEQGGAVEEMVRLLKPDGLLLLSVPNLAHLASRFTFMFLGRLLRTSEIERHPGDRPIHEYLKLLEGNFQVTRRVGMFPTFPLISLLTRYAPSKVVGLHRLYNRILGYPNWCFLNIFTCEKV